MTNYRISHLKIAIRTLLIMVIVLVVICILNSWPNINLAFHGQSPSPSVWTAKSFRSSNLITVLVLAIFVYARTWSHEKKMIRNRKVTDEQNRLWDQAQ